MALDDPTLKPPYPSSRCYKGISFMQRSKPKYKRNWCVCECVCVCVYVCVWVLHLEIGSF